MEEKRRSNKEIMLLIVFTGLVYLAVMNFKELLGVWAAFIKMVRPFLIGGCIAFVVNLILNFVENRVLNFLPAKLQRIKRPLGILLSFIILLLFMILIVGTVVPQLGTAVNRLGLKLPVFWEKILQKAEILMIDYPEIVDWIIEIQYQKVNWDSILGTTMDFLKNGARGFLNSTVNVAGNLVGGVVSSLISLIFSIYILSQKERLGQQLKTLIQSYCGEKTQTTLLHVADLLYRNFSKFITGQCTEAVILGALFIIVMTVAKMPYAFMIGVLIGFTSLIPIVGGFIGCFVGAFMILVEDPVRAFWFVIMFLVIQQLEGNLIYPKVVGNSVGLPSIWVLVAVSLGSSLFGVVGMLVFIPLFATAYMLLKEDVIRRRKQGK